MRFRVFPLIGAAVISCSREPEPVLGGKSAITDTPVSSVSVLSSTTATIDSAAGRHEDSVAASSPPSSAASAADLKMLRGELIIPVSGILPGELRDTYKEARGEGRVHDAIDIPAPRGTNVLSAGPGRVLKLFTSKAGGLMVYAADSSERFILLYAHLDGYAPGLSDRSPLTRGQTIGFVGTTGNAPPNLPHLHFAIERATDISKWWQGTAINPYPLLRTK